MMPHEQMSPGEKAIIAAIERMQADTQTQIAVLVARVDVVEQAFPHGDPVRHRIYHERLIQKGERWDDFKHKILYYIATMGVTGAIGFTVIAIGDALIKAIKQ